MALVALTSLACAGVAYGGDIVAYATTGQMGGVGYEAKVAWGQGLYGLDLWARVQTGSPNFARNRQATESALEQRLEAVFLQSVLGLPVSSRETVGAFLGTQPAVLGDLRRVVGRAVKRASSLTPEMEDVRLRYTIPLYGEGGLLSIFAPRGGPTPLEPYLGFVPSAAYTGLVIFVQGAYPAYGREGVETSLRVCLFPRLYDTDLRLVLDVAQVDRSSLLAWGMVAYSNDLDEVLYAERVGANPLRTVARGVFGVGNTDIVISREMARLLLSREENRVLLREGRILVILDAPAAPLLGPQPGEMPEEMMEMDTRTGGTGP
jgi:hypothetical protein